MIGVRYLFGMLFQVIGQLQDLIQGNSFPNEPQIGLIELRRIFVSAQEAYRRMTTKEFVIVSSSCTIRVISRDIVPMMLIPCSIPAGSDDRRIPGSKFSASTQEHWNPTDLWEDEGATLSNVDLLRLPDRILEVTVSLLGRLPMGE